MKLHIPVALHHRQFRLLWLGLMVSIAGSQMQTWALFWQIRTLTDQPIALGGIGLARIIPVVVFSLIGGAVADATDRRKMLFLTQSLLALLALVLALLTFAEKISLWQIYLLTALQAVVVAFDLPARQAMVPNLLPAADLPNAFSMNSIALQVGSIAGPALSGLVIASMGQSATYVINSLSYGAVILALVLMGPVQQKVSLPRRKAVSFGAIKEGMQFILSRPLIFSTMILDFLATFFSSANTLMPIIAVDVLHVGVVQYGWLSAAQSIGAGFAAVFLSQVDQIRRQGPIFLVSVISFGVATILFGLSATFSAAMVTLSLIGAADSVSAIIRNTIRQLQTPDEIRGRMTSINQIFFMGGPQLGEIEAGLVAQFFGATFAIVSGGIGCIIAVGLVIRKWPQLARYNGDEPIAAGGQC